MKTRFHSHMALHWKYSSFKFFFLSTVICLFSLVASKILYLVPWSFVTVCVGTVNCLLNLLRIHVAFRNQRITAFPELSKLFYASKGSSPWSLPFPFRFPDTLVLELFTLSPKCLKILFIIFHLFISAASVPRVFFRAVSQLPSSYIICLCYALIHSLLFDIF